LKEIYPEEQFNGEFVTKALQIFIKGTDTANLLNWSTGLAVFISCLGLGLVTYNNAKDKRDRSS
jgi:hypothetical protein